MMNFIKKIFAHKFLKIIMWVFLILVGLFIILIIFRVVHLFNQDKINAEVEKIHNTKLTLSDVMGDNLPPPPGVEADKTVAGIDANNNGIRDDVELAVFEAYPDSAKTRAVLLQYALTLQMEMTLPILTTETATEVEREQSRGFECIGDILLRDDLQKFNNEADSLTKFVEEKQFNTLERENERNIFVKKVRSYSGLNRICDIDYSLLPN